MELQEEWPVTGRRDGRRWRGCRGCALPAGFNVSISNHWSPFLHVGGRDQSPVGNSIETGHVRPRTRFESWFRAVGEDAVLDEMVCQRPHGGIKTPNADDTDMYVIIYCYARSFPSHLADIERSGSATLNNEVCLPSQNMRNLSSLM